MPLLFSLHLSSHREGFGKPFVRAVERGLVGVYRAGKPYGPDRAAIREALPHYYRKAFDRADGTFWLTEGTENFHVDLRDARGRYLNRVYAMAYDFDPGT